MLHKTLRIVAFCVLASLAVIATMQIQQRILRIRAGHLLSDVRSLVLRNSSWSDAQRVFARWGAWGHYDGVCTSQNCDYRIELGDFFYTHPRLIPEALWARRAYAFLGLRVTRIEADVVVWDGVVWGKGFSVWVEVPPEGGPDAPFGNGYTLIGGSKTVSRFASAGYSPQLVMHPYYAVTTPGGCTGCLAVFARFTPFADPTDVARLMDFNLSCLTSRKPCREKGDIMPSAWRQYLAEGKAFDFARNDLRRCRSLPEWEARDTDNAVIVDVLSNRTENASEPYQVSTVRLVERLKAASFWEIGTTREVRVFPGTVSLTRTNRPQDVSAGARFIMFFAHYHFPDPTGPEVWLDQCGAVPWTDFNLEAARRGIKQDFGSSVPSQ
jgi:hypothetical protein